MKDLTSAKGVSGPTDEQGTFSNGLPDTLVDEVTLSGSQFRIKVGSEVAFKEAIQGAKGLGRVVVDKATEFAQRIQIGLTDGKPLGEVIQPAYDQVYTPLEAAKYLASGQRLLQSFWADYTPEVDSFITNKRSELSQSRPSASVDVTNRGRW